MTQVVRKTPRQRMLKTGTISFNRAGGIDCVVRNLSPAGACLEIDSPVGIPDDFLLVVPADSLKHNCHVVWRAAKRIGVAFA